MERKVISKSAPAARRRNSTKKDKVSTVNEINKWINKGNGDHISRACSRGVSSLTENVTEERMLYSRQLELGRERYKFLANHEYQKHKFVERQNNKDKMMKQYMASARKVIDKAHSEKPKPVLTIRIPQMEDESARSSPVVDDLPARSESRVSRVSSKAGKDMKTTSDNTKRLQSAASRDVLSMYATRASQIDPRERGRVKTKSAKSVSKKHDDSESTKPKAVETERVSSKGRGVYFNTSDTPGKGDSISVETKLDNWLPAVHDSNNQSNYNAGQPAIQERSRSTSPSKSVRYGGIPTDPIKSAMRSEPTTPKWTKSPRAFEKLGEKFDTSINDPRYVALTNTLMTVGDIKMPQIGVKEIIENNEVFKYVSKSEDAAHAKQMHAKFIALLLENEFK